MKYSDFLWGDSILKDIKIQFEHICLVIYNEVIGRDVLIQCVDCVEISSIVFDEDWIIDCILLDETPTRKHFFSNESSEGFIHLKLNMVSGQHYCIKCKDIVFKVVQNETDSRDITD